MCPEAIGPRFSHTKLWGVIELFKVSLEISNQYATPKITKVLKNMARNVTKLQHNVTKMIQNASKFHKIAAKCVKMSQNCIKMSQNASKCHNIASKCNKMRQNVTTCVNMSQNDSKMWHKMSQNHKKTAKSLGIFIHIGTFSTKITQPKRIEIFACKFLFIFA